MEQVFGALLALRRGAPDQNEWIVSCLAGAWAKLLGDRLATVCRPVAFSKGRLTIEASDASWERALRDLQPELEEKLRTATAGEIASVAIKKDGATL